MLKQVFAVVFAAGLASGAAAEEWIVRMGTDAKSGRMRYQPARLLIRSGDTVTWVNDDVGVEHDVSAYPAGIPEGAEPFASPSLHEPGQRWSMTFERPGTYRYHCHPHEAKGMRGEVIVDRESRPSEFRKARPGEMRHEHHEGAAHRYEDGKLHSH